MVPKKRKNLLISESYIGSHADIDTLNYFDADLISFTFAPVIKIKGHSVNDIENIFIPQKFRGIWFNGINILREKESVDICKEIKKAGHELIIVGTDNDYEGNGMAKMLQLGLIKEGVSADKILRVPLDYNGYNKLVPFWDMKTFRAYLRDKFEEKVYLNFSKKVKGNGHGISRRLAYMLSILDNPPEYVKNINPSGTSTITYLTKKELHEK